MKNSNFLKRTIFLSTVYFFVIGGISSCKQADKFQETDRPNILCIIVDDLRPELNCFGESQMITPNIDRIARQGLIFNNHHVQIAVCIPSRVALLTSVRPTTTRQLFGTLIFRKTSPGIKTMAEHFHDHGYYTAYRGKVVHGEYPEGRVRYGLDEETYAPDWTDSYVEPVNRNLWDFGPKYARPACESSDKPDSLFLDGIIMKRALKTMENCANAGKPFFLTVGLHKPHLPFSAPIRFWDLYNRDEIELVENNFFPENMPLQAYNGWGDAGGYRETPDPDKMFQAVKNGTHFPEMSEDSARLLKHGYYACVSWTDYNIGLLLDKLEKLHLEKNTIIVLWGDHGWHLGEHQMWSKSSNFTVATRSPLIFSFPGIKSKNQKTEALVESVDVFPTLTELCGLPQPPLTEGCSFSKLLENPRLPWKKAAFSMYFRGKEPNRTIGFSMLTEKYRYNEWVTGWTEYRSTSRSDYKVVARELYDHITDPRENINIAGFPENSTIITDLADQLYEGAQSAGPVGWKPLLFPKGWETKDWLPGWTNTGFESGGMMDWEATGEGIKTTISFVDYHSGGHSLLVSDRVEKDHSVLQRVKLNPDKGYNVTIWVKCLKGNSKANLTIGFGGRENLKIKVLDQKDVNDMQWTKLEGWFRGGHELLEAEQYVSVVLDETVDFYLDDFSIE